MIAASSAGPVAEQVVAVGREPDDLDRSQPAGPPDRVELGQRRRLRPVLVLHGDDRHDRQVETPEDRRRSVSEHRHDRALERVRADRRDEVTRRDLDDRGPRGTFLVRAPARPGPRPGDRRGTRPSIGGSRVARQGRGGTRPGSGRSPSRGPASRRRRGRDHRSGRRARRRPTPRRCPRSRDRRARPGGPPFPDRRPRPVPGAPSPRRPPRHRPRAWPTRRAPSAHRTIRARAGRARPSGGPGAAGERPRSSSRPWTTGHGRGGPRPDRPARPSRGSGSAPRGRPRPRSRRVPPCRRGSGPSA